MARHNQEGVRMPRIKLKREQSMDLKTVTDEQIVRQAVPDVYCDEQGGVWLSKQHRLAWEKKTNGWVHSDSGDEKDGVLGWTWAAARKHTRVALKAHPELKEDSDAHQD